MLKENQFYLPIHMHIESHIPNYQQLLQWLNVQHCGKKIPPENVTKEHMDASWDMKRWYAGKMLCELQKDGTYIPISFNFNGKIYKLIENEKDSKST